MGPESGSDEREVRAARNQALFRAVNEKMRELSDAIVEMTGTFTIACECADANCVEPIEIAPADYEAIRASPRCFAVLADHTVPEIEHVTRVSDGYVVVEKEATAAEIAETIAAAQE